MRRLGLICVLAALLAGCGSGGGSSTPSSTLPAVSAPGGKSATGAVTRVSMKSIQFTPKTVAVKKGATVEWANDDPVNHDVTKTSGPGPNFSSGKGAISSGDTYEVTFKTAGTIRYRCTIHPGMNGTIVVK
jgi:plastocyanin